MLVIAILYEVIFLKKEIKRNFDATPPSSVVENQNHEILCPGAAMLNF